MNFISAKEKLINENLSIIIFDEADVKTSIEKGVVPLLRILKEDNSSINGKYIVDKVIGRAAAFLMIYGGVKKCYGVVISKSAITLFEENNIDYSFDEIIDYIQNRDKTDLCPLEKLVLNINDPKEAFDKIYEFAKHRL